MSTTSDFLEDKDAYPVTGGFAWIHWLAANITRFEIKENESQMADDFVQGRNFYVLTNVIFCDIIKREQ